MCGKGFAFSTFPQRGDEYITIATEPEQKQTIEPIPDISTLLRIGHFYFALTDREIFLEVERCRW
jgi:hypothetical protein